MKRVAIIADSHWDEHSRFEETARIHDWIARDMTERGVDLVLHAGDVFERKSTPKERLAVASWLRCVAVQAPVVIVRGNHDAVGDLALFQQLETRHPVIVEEAAGVHVVAGVAVGCLSWPRRSELLAQAESRDAVDGDARHALQNVVRGLGAELALHQGPRVLLAHAMVRGSVTSTGQPLVGCDMELGLEDLSLADAHIVALGHIHMGQAWESTDGAPVAYPGSPRRATFGETEPKGYLVATFDGARLVSVERVETPATPMLHITASLDEGELELDEAVASVADAEVRFRYSIPADEREFGRREAARWRGIFEREGAISVQVEEVVITTTRARAPEVAAATGVGEKLRAFWAAKGTTPTSERSAELIKKAQSIETEFHRAS